MARAVKAAKRDAALRSYQLGTGFTFRSRAPDEGEDEDESTRLTLLVQRTEREYAAERNKALRPKEAAASPAAAVPGILEIAFKTFTPQSPQGLGLITRQDGWYLGYLSSGRCDWICQDRLHELRPGSVCLVPPGVPHGGFDHVLQTCRCYWMVVDPDRLTGLPATAAEMKALLDKVGNVTFFGGLDLGQLFERLLAAQALDNDLERLQARLCAMLLLTDAIRSESETVRSVVSKHEALPDLVIQATRLFSADVTSIPTVSQVARNCQVSRGHLHRLFTEHLGVSPKTYVQELRMRRARDLLKDGLPVREVAAKVSLATAGELRRLFVQSLGCQPEEWMSRYAQLWETGNRLPGQAD